MPPGMRGITLRELIDKPFGPYLEEQALAAACKSTTVKHPVTLRRFLLECGNEYTGLDESEPCQPGHNQDRFADTPVRFRGILEIQSLSWLTDAAYQAIERELRARDVRARSAHGAQANSSTLSLKHLYDPTPGFGGGQLKIKVEIQGVKHLPAVYLTSTFVPNGLLIISNGQNRRYAVETMHFHTYKRSALYLSRYRVLQVLRDLLALDARSNHFTNNRTPLPERTPNWFVDLYLTHMAYTGKARRHRPVYDSDDSDIEPGSAGRLRRGCEHTLRHVSRAEVLSLFAMHAEWLIQQVANMRMNKWLDVDVWKAWLVDVRRLRRQAAREGETWGVWEGADVPEDDDSLDGVAVVPSARPKGKKFQQARPNPASVGPSSARRSLPHLKKRGSATRSSSRTSGVASPSTRSTDSSALGSQHSRGRPPSPGVDETMLRTYDSDFSPASTPPGSPSSSSSGLPSRPPSPVDPALAARIPSEFFVLPQVTATFQWVCPVERCGYLIDLLHLTEENLDTEDITEDEKRRLKSRSWNIREDWVRDAFGYMVDKHLFQHLDEWDIKFEVDGKHVKASWKHPPHSDGQLSKVKVDNRRQRPVIKEEDA
ncbi:hypothetical protein BN946_scf184911.g51 [Trametes cinnabarina]|uniref:Uncharacterized protein n=1 Tax=Pycnoporus cinnabarinus TaxID=5643 RepID=A0A060SBG2_PYCCI|nr:hypothetical protein BN946_scf184911.g51 [Trametes cinnabarina]